MRRMNFSAADVNSMDICFVSLIYTAAANRGTAGLIMHVFGIGQAATHCGSSKKPMHSVHLAGSTWKPLSASKIALFGHSALHAPQPMQLDSLIMYAIVDLPFLHV